MNQNPYSPTKTFPPTKSGPPRISWERFIVLNAFWIVLLAAGLFSIYLLNSPKIENQLPPRYAAYDHEVTIHRYSTIFVIVILLGIPNLLAYLFGLFSKPRNTISG